MESAQLKLKCAGRRPGIRIFSCIKFGRLRIIGCHVPIRRGDKVGQFFSSESRGPWPGWDKMAGEAGVVPSAT